jgi:hypothetical protein
MLFSAKPHADKIVFFKECTLFKFISILADITKTLSAKRKRLENYTQNSLKTTNKKVDDIWKGQNAERYICPCSVISFSLNYIYMNI